MNPDVKLIIQFNHDNENTKRDWEDEIMDLIFEEYDEIYDMKVTEVEENGITDKEN